MESKNPQDGRKGGWSYWAFQPCQDSLKRSEGRGRQTQNQAVYIKLISKEKKKDKPSFITSIHQILKFLSQEWIAKSYTQEFILKLLNQTPWSWELVLWTLFFFFPEVVLTCVSGSEELQTNISQIWLINSKNHLKPKNMASWSLPHSELVRIFGDGTPEYVLLQAPRVILISSQVLEWLPYTTS